MAGDEEDSWKSMFVASEYFDAVECQIEGMGRIAAIEDIYVQHTQAAIESDGIDASESAAAGAEALEDGVYHAKFTTDSSMFHVNETLDDLGVLTVENGHMTIHVSLAGTGIVNLYPGLAAQAQEEGAELLFPTEDTVTYEDGTEEIVNGYDIPVPVIGEEFDVALVGQKGKWYDHKVMVSDPVPAE
jgi:hypothetical protein